MKVRGIKGRWTLSSLSITLVVVLVAVLAFVLIISNYYYSGIRSDLESKAKASSEFFTSYVSNTYAEYQQAAVRYTESFEEKDELELQFINTKGVVEVTSYGISAGTKPGTQDIADALATGEVSAWEGHSSTGERVLAVSAPLIYSDGSVVGVMRYVTSLTLVDHQVITFSALIAGIGILVFLMVFLSNTYFIRTITEPILALTEVARRIAEGSYGIQAEKKHDDEIGTLTDAINEMSVKIGQSEKVQTEFISSVSHELRTPLTAITGWSETLAYDEAIQGDSRRGIQIISKEASRLTKMVEELLEFTRIQDGRFNLNVEPIDVAAELEDSIYTYGELLRQDQVELLYTPSEEPLPHILGDGERLKQVFLNILDNAAKYGREGGKIEVNMDLDGDSVRIRVRDHGPGIPEDELPHVKEKFYKGSSKVRGSGIGLAVCEEIVTRHGGTLEIANAPEGGCVVTVRLPVLQEEPKE